MIMEKTKRIILSMWVLLTFFLFGNAQQSDSEKKIVVAYVTSWSKIMPEPQLMTHINYAFGHVNDTFDGVRVDNPERGIEEGESGVESADLYRWMGKWSFQ